MKKLALLPLALAGMFSATAAQADDGLFTGDVRLACEAVLCLSSGTRPSECAPSLKRYFSISHKKLSDAPYSFVREKGQCDGLVGRYSSHLGTVIGDDYALDHFDIVNQSLGLVGKGAEPIRLFVEHARRLKAAGV